jgi:hypothetical protein
MASSLDVSKAQRSVEFTVAPPDNYAAKHTLPLAQRNRSDNQLEYGFG